MPTSPYTNSIPKIQETYFLNVRNQPLKTLFTIPQFSNSKTFIRDFLLGMCNIEQACKIAHFLQYKNFTHQRHVI